MRLVSRFGVFHQVCVFVLLVVWAVTPTVWAQSVEFTPLVPASDCVELLIQDDLIVGGYSNGGLVLWDRLAPDVGQRVVAGDELSGNLITDLAWTGLNTWVATSNGGLTRISDLTTNPQYRQFTGVVLGDLNIRAVAGSVVGGSEVVYYALDSGGMGIISGGLSGDVLTEADGLVDNTINALFVFEDAAFIATPSGISRYRASAFVTVNTGLTDLAINAFAVSAQGDLLAGGDGGLFRWDSGLESWTLMAAVSNTILEIATNETDIWILRPNLVNRWTGAGFESVTLPMPNCAAICADEGLWIGGRYTEPGMSTALSKAYLGKQEAAGDFSTWVTNELLVKDANGTTIGNNNDIWIGSRWGRAASGYDGDVWDHISDRATADNDSSGLFNHYGPMLAMACGAGDEIWINQFGSGVIRRDPATGLSKLANTGNSGLQGNAALSIVPHPDGTMLFLHDSIANGATNGLVDVLIDSVNWRNPDNWLNLPTQDDRLGGGTKVWDAAVERNDVIWFAVQDVGLVRWDVNGDAAGPDDPLTWLDTSDDRWDSAVADFAPYENDPTVAETTLTVTKDGSLWIGGNGLVRFNYNIDSRTAEVLDAWSEKSSAFFNGLLSGKVTDLVVDVNDDVWVCMTVGLNRIRRRTDTTFFDAYMDLANYYSNSIYQQLYSPAVITPLPGGAHIKMAASADGHLLSVTSDRGAGMINVSTASTGVSESLASLYCYPNPMEFESADSMLKLGGFSADATNNDPAVLEIYNLEGELVYRNRYVSAETGAWDGTTRMNTQAVTGLYLVKVTWHGMTATRTLALVR